MDRPSPLHPVLVFELGAEMFGVRLDAVREIHRATYLRRVPLAPRAIRGLTDVRGRMVTGVDLPSLLAGQELGADVAGHLAILAEPRDHLALWFASEIDLRNLDLGGLRPRPAGDREPDAFEGFVASGPRIVNLLSTEKIVLHCEREVLRRYRVVSG
jgi:chemotaxis signal transduction protein